MPAHLQPKHAFLAIHETTGARSARMSMKLARAVKAAGVIEPILQESLVREPTIHLENRLGRRGRGVIDERESFVRPERHEPLAQQLSIFELFRHDRLKP